MAKQMLAALLLLSIAGVHVLGDPTERPPPGGYPSHCAPFSCTRHCPNGHVDDDRGCQTCQCKDGRKVCQPANCSRTLNCPRGYQKDQYGCDICSCNPGGPVCPQVVCPRPCTNGYVIRDGCQTCDCIPVGPKVCQPANCPRTLNCPRGYQKDQYGCDICSCNPGGPVCPQLVCPRSCTNGYVIRDGCQTCDCIPVDACYDRCRGYCSTRKGRPAGCTCNCGDDRRLSCPASSLSERWAEGQQSLCKLHRYRTGTFN